MVTLSKSQEIDLLTTLLTGVSIGTGWKAVQQQIDTTLGCLSFLNEYRPDGAPTDRYFGTEAAEELARILDNYTSPHETPAFSFLLADAEVGVPFCKSELVFSPAENPPLEMGDTGGQTASNQLHGLEPGLFCPVRRANGTTLMFALLYTNHTSETIDRAAATKAFKSLAKTLLLAVDAQDHIDQLKHEHSIYREILETIGPSAVLVNSHREVLHQTGNCLEILERTGTAIHNQNRLYVHDHRLETAFGGLTSNSTTGAPGKSGAYGPDRSIFTQSPDGELHRISIQKAGLRDSHQSEENQHYFLIRTFSPTSIPEGIETILQDHFDLSQTEARLSRELALTGSIPETLEKLGIKKNTSKTHLRSIFEKTGVHTQLELVRLVLRMASLG